MKSQGWFQKDRPGPRRPLPAARIAARLRPHELIAMLTHHYARARARSLPRVAISISVSNPSGKQAVVIACK